MATATKSPQVNMAAISKLIIDSTNIDAGAHGMDLSAGSAPIVSLSENSELAVTTKEGIALNIGSTQDASLKLGSAATDKSSASFTSTSSTKPVVSLDLPAASTEFDGMYIGSGDNTLSITNDNANASGTNDPALQLQTASLVNVNGSSKVVVSNTAGDCISNEKASEVVFNGTSSLEVDARDTGISFKGDTGIAKFEFLGVNNLLIGNKIKPVTGIKALGTNNSAYVLKFGDDTTNDEVNINIVAQESGIDTSENANFTFYAKGKAGSNVDISVSKDDGAYGVNSVSNIEFDGVDLKVTNAGIQNGYGILIQNANLTTKGDVELYNTDPSSTNVAVGLLTSSADTTWTSTGASSSVSDLLVNTVQSKHGAGVSAATSGGYKAKFDHTNGSLDLSTTCPSSPISIVGVLDNSNIDSIILDSQGDAPAFSSTPTDVSLNNTDTAGTITFKGNTSFKVPADKSKPVFETSAQETKSNTLTFKFDNSGKTNNFSTGANNDIIKQKNVNKTKIDIAAASKFTIKRADGSEKCLAVTNAKISTSIGQADSTADDFVVISGGTEQDNALLKRNLV